MGENNRHHLLWQKKEWDHGNLKALRMHRYCVVNIPVQTLHRMIHEQIETIPVPTQANAEYVLEHILYLEKMGGIKNTDPIDKRLQILIALFNCMEQPTADALKKQLEIVREYYKEEPPS